MLINSKLSDENIKFYINKEKLSFVFKNYNIYKYSNDYLNIRDDRKSGKITNSILRKSKNIISQHINKGTSEYIDENVISFISSFTTGTVHGYASIWEYIIYYIKNNCKLKIILSTITQSGIVEIVSHIFGKKNIIFLKPNIIYNIKNITFIPLGQMHFSDTFWTYVEPFFKNHIINDKFNSDIKRIAIMKTNSTTNCTRTGMMDHRIVNKFCKKNKLYNLIPSTHNEIETANLIYKCEVFICSWGTAYYKNIRYVGNNCKYIYVFISKGFISQYNSRKNRTHSHTYKKYKNAVVKYIIINDISSFVI